MREHLIQYVNLLFAGTTGTEEIRQEILQNTLDRFDDLVAQGKSPEAAYSLAISGIGDISEILGSHTATVPASAPVLDPSRRFKPEYRNAPVWKKLLRAIAVFLCIVAAIPLIILSEFGMEIIGLCATLGTVGIAVVLFILSGSNKDPEAHQTKKAEPENETLSALKKLINVVFLVGYFLISFTTGAWYITWLIFPIEGAIWGLIKAVADKKDAKSGMAARIIIYSLLALLLTGILVVASCLHIYGFPSQSSEGTISEGEAVSMVATEVSQLELDWVAGSITIQTADTDQITFSESGTNIGNHHLAYRLDNGVLSIEYSNTSVSIGFNSMPEKDLTITVPTDWLCKGLELNGAALDVKIDGLNVVDLDIDGAANEINFRGIVQEVECDGASCDLTLTCLEKPNKINLDGASIELELYLPEDCGFLVQMDGLSSSFHSALDYKNRSGEYVYGDSHCKVFADGVSCSVTISLAPAVIEAE